MNDGSDFVHSICYCSTRSCLIVQISSHKCKKRESQLQRLQGTKKMHRLPKDMLDAPMPNQSKISICAVFMRPSAMPIPTPDATMVKPWPSRTIASPNKPNDSG